jgi:hypothetical protein
VSNLRDAPLPTALREERLRLTAEVLQGLARLPESRWLVVGAVDLRGAVRESASHAFRMAAAELHFGRPGFWQRVVDLYESGVWPAAADDGESILVV